MIGAEKMGGGTAIRTAAVLLMFALAGCGHLSGLHMPWHHNPPPPPPEVHELDVTTEGGGPASFPQYWQRNTLLVDLQGVSGSGSIVLKPREHTTWPVRLAFRVLPGQIGVLELHADQRVLLPITAQGSRPIDLEIVPGVYSVKTARIVVNWGPATAVTP